MDARRNRTQNIVWLSNTTLTGSTKIVHYSYNKAGAKPEPNRCTLKYHYAAIGRYNSHDSDARHNMLKDATIQKLDKPHRRRHQRTGQYRDSRQSSCWPWARVVTSARLQHLTWTELSDTRWQYQHSVCYRTKPAFSIHFGAKTFGRHHGPIFNWQKHSHLHWPSYSMHRHTATFINQSSLRQNAA